MTALDTGRSAASKEPHFMRERDWERDRLNDEHEAYAQAMEDDVYRSESRDTGATGGSEL